MKKNIINIVNSILDGKTGIDRQNALHTIIVGETGLGYEWKTIRIWCEKEFGIKVPDDLKNDTKLYTYNDVCNLLE